MNIEKFISTSNNLAPAGWKHPKHILDAVAAAKRDRNRKARQARDGSSGDKPTQKTQEGRTAQQYTPDMDTKMLIELRKLGYTAAQALFIIRNCGTGSGGFGEGNDCAKGKAGKDGDGDGQFEGSDGKGSGGKKIKGKDGDRESGGDKKSGKAQRGPAGTKTPQVLEAITDAADRQEFADTALALSAAYDEVDAAQGKVDKARTGKPSEYKRALKERKEAKAKRDDLQGKMDRIAKPYDIDPDYAFEAVVTLKKEGKDISDYSGELGEEMKELTLEELEEGATESTVDEPEPPKKKSSRSFAHRLMQLRKSGVPVTVAIRIARGQND